MKRYGTQDIVSDTKAFERDEYLNFKFFTFFSGDFFFLPNTFRNGYGVIKKTGVNKCFSVFILKL